MLASEAWSALRLHVVTIRGAFALLGFLCFLSNFGFYIGFPFFVAVVIAAANKKSDDEKIVLHHRRRAVRTSFSRFLIFCGAYSVYAIFSVVVVSIVLFSLIFAKVIPALLQTPLFDIPISIACTVRSVVPDALPVWGWQGSESASTRCKYHVVISFLLPMVGALMFLALTRKFGSLGDAMRIRTATRKSSIQAIVWLTSLIVFFEVLTTASKVFVAGGGKRSSSSLLKHIWRKAQFRAPYDYMEIAYGHLVLRCFIVFCLVWLTAFVFQRLIEHSDAGANS